MTESYPSAAETTGPGEQTLALSIVEAVAATKDTDPTALDLQLSDHVDLDALNTLYNHSTASEETSWQVRFRVDEVEVTVRSNGRIMIERY